MQLIAATRPEAAAYAYGAYLAQGGTRLRCGLLFVQKGNHRPTLTLRCPDTNTRIRVRLPALAIKAKRHCRFSRIELEVLTP